MDMITELGAFKTAKYALFKNRSQPTKLTPMHAVAMIDKIGHYRIVQRRFKDTLAVGNVLTKKTVKLC